MRAAALDRFGGVETIQMKTLPVPEPGPDEVLLRVESAGVGVWDPYEREGEFAKIFGTQPRFPYVLGSDGAGTVAAVGEQVRGLKEGDRAYALALVNPKGGFYAEYAAVKAEYVSPIPKKLTVEQAGAMPSDALTALRGLDEVLRLKSGESLLVFGAGGGIGHLAVQLAKRMSYGPKTPSHHLEGSRICCRLMMNEARFLISVSKGSVTKYSRYVLRPLSW